MQYFQHGRVNGMLSQENVPNEARYVYDSLHKFE